MSFVDRISWNAYNESMDLLEQIEAYRRRFGHYPASVHVDQIYRTRANRQFCHSKGIRLSGPLHTGLTPVATRFCGSSEFFGAEPGRLR